MNKLNFTRETPVPGTGNNTAHKYIKMEGIRLFDKDIIYGMNAENTFLQFYGQLSRYNVLSPIRKTLDCIEGKDIESIGITDQGIKPVFAEVKALLGNNFIRRDNNNMLPCGTIEFELWSNAWRDDSTVKPRQYWTPGWLQKMIHCDEIREYQMMNGNDTEVCQPDQLAYMLCKDSAGNEPYACVLFDNFEKLKERLFRIAPFDLNNIPSPTRWPSFWNDSINVPFNSWYVALDKIVDLSRITVFEDVTMEPDPKSKCPIEIQKARAAYIKEHASNSISIRTETANAQNAGKAYNRDRGLPENAEIPHMTAFDPDKLPPSVLRFDKIPEWWLEMYNL